MYYLTIFTLIVATALALPHNKKGYSIIGGNIADIADHPWQVAVLQSGNLLCGGFLISDDWVVTAGGCGDPSIFVDPVTVRVGSSFYNSGGKVISVDKEIQHPNYNPDPLLNDILLLHLQAPINTTIAKPAQIASQEQVIPDGSLVTISGWGVVSEWADTPSTTLKEVTIPTINNEVCKSDYEGTFNHLVTDNMFCAGLSDEGGKSACRKDSGGPVTLDGVVVGIVSWRYLCGEPKYPDVYTKLSSYRDWIKENTGI